MIYTWYLKCICSDEMSQLKESAKVLYKLIGQSPTVLLPDKLYGEAAVLW